MGGAALVLVGVAFLMTLLDDWHLVALGNVERIDRRVESQTVRSGKMTYIRRITYNTIWFTGNTCLLNIMGDFDDIKGPAELWHNGSGEYELRVRSSDGRAPAF